MLSLVKPSGWAFGELLTSGQMEAIDASQAKAIDGTGGGTYTPSVKIIINGQGLQVNTLTVTGTLSLLGNTTIGNSPTDALSVLATSTFSSPVTFNDAFTTNDTADFFADTTIHTGALFTVGGNASLGNDSGRTLTVGATSTFNAPVTVNDNVDIWGDLTCHSATTATLAGNVLLGNDISKTLSIYAALATALAYTGDGRIPFSNGGTLPNRNTTLTAGQGQIWRVNPAATAIWTVTLSTTGAGDGDWVLFWQGAGNSSVASSGPSILSPTSEQNLFNHFDGKNLQWALYVFVGGGWYLAALSS